MNISPELWDLIKTACVGYFLYVLNKTDRNQRELFKRIRSVELMCARTHGPGQKVIADEDP